MCIDVEIVRVNGRAESLVSGEERSQVNMVTTGTVTGDGVIKKRVVTVAPGRDDSTGSTGEEPLQGVER